MPTDSAEPERRHQARVRHDVRIVVSFYATLTLALSSMGQGSAWQKSRHPQSRRANLDMCHFV